MHKILKLRRGNTATTNTFVGSNGEVTIDTDKHVLVVHDGTTPGGWPQAAASSLTLPIASPTVLGGIKIGTGLNIDGNGVVTVNTASIGNLSIDNQTINGTVINGNIAIAPNGTGRVVLSGLSFPRTDGNVGQTLVTDGHGNIYWSTPSSVTFSTTTPANPHNGDIWVDSNSGIEYIYYTDTDSSQWVEFGPVNTQNDTINFLALNTNVVPAADSFYDLGTPTKQWRSLHVSGNTIYINNVPVTLDNDNNLLINGNLVTGGTANLGNIRFLNDSIYDLQGINLINNDLVHGGTAWLQIPQNGSGDINLGNYYGNAVVSMSNTGYANLKSWTFGGDGTFNLPSFTTGGYTDSAWLQTTGNIIVNANGALFTFGSDNSLQFPDGSKQTSAFQLFTGNAAPDSNYRLWYNTQEGRIYVNYNNQWLDASPQIIPTLSSIDNSGQSLVVNANGSITFPDGTVQYSAYTNVGDHDFTGNLTVPYDHFIGFVGEDTNWGMGYRHANYTKQTVYSSIDLRVGSGHYNVGDDGFSIGQTNGISLFEINGYTTDSWFRRDLVVNRDLITGRDAYVNRDLYVGNGINLQVANQAGNNVIYANNGNVQIYSEHTGETNVQIRAKGAGGDSLWKFDSSGVLIFPDSSVQTTAFQLYTGDTAPANTHSLWFNTTDGRSYVYYNNQWIDANPSVPQPLGLVGQLEFDNTTWIEGGYANVLTALNQQVTVSTIDLHTNYYENSSGLRIYPTVSENQHVHLTAISPQDLLHLGDDRGYVRTGYNQDIAIGTNGGEYLPGGHYWLFTNGGDLILPNGGTIRDYSNNDLLSDETEGVLTLNNGDDQTGYTREALKIGYWGAGHGYNQILHTRHNASTGTNNAWDFYTSDGTQINSIGTGSIHGLTITNGRVGVAQLNPGYTLDVSGNINFTGNLYQNGNLFSGGGTFDGNLLTFSATANTPQNNAATDKITLYPISGQWSYGIGVESCYTWFDVGTGGYGYKFYNQGNLKYILDNDNGFYPYSDNLKDLGTNSNRWRDLHISGTVNVGNSLYFPQSGQSQSLAFQIGSGSNQYLGTGDDVTFGSVTTDLIKSVHHTASGNIRSGLPYPGSGSNNGYVGVGGGWPTVAGWGDLTGYTISTVVSGSVTSTTTITQMRQDMGGQPAFQTTNPLPGYQAGMTITLTSPSYVPASWDSLDIKTGDSNIFAFGADGTLGFASGKKMRLVNPPAHSTGSSGDKAGDMAFDGNYLYYCIVDFGGYPTQTFTVDNVGQYTNVITVNKAANPNYTIPQQGWTVTLGELMTLTQYSSDGSNGTYNFLFDINSLIPLPSTVTLTSNVAATNIWVRVAWSGSTW